MDIQFTEDPLDYERQIIQYLVATGDASGLNMQLKKLGRNTQGGYFIKNLVFLSAEDVTGDSVKEVVLLMVQSIDSEKSMADGGPPENTAILIIGCRNNEYTGLYRYITRSYGSGSNPLIVKDLNADGIREVIFSFQIDVGARGDESILSQVLEWSGVSFGELIPGYSLSTNSYPEFRDIDGNGTTELLAPRVDMERYCEDGPIRTSYTIYMWDGESFRYVWTDPGIPEYKFQAALDGDYYAWIGLYDKSENMYLRAIADVTLKAFSFNVWAEKNYLKDAEWMEKPIPANRK